MVVSKRNRTLKPMKFAVILILSIIGAALIGVGIWAVRFARTVEDPWGTLSPSITNAPKATQDPLKTQDPNATPEPTSDPNNDDPQLIWGKDVINILFIGYDKDTSREDTYNVFRTDTLILLTVYYKENRVVMTSVPRDSYVYIPIADQKARINSVPYFAQVYKTDTYEAICSTVSRLFGGVPVEHYMALDMDLFVEVIDLLGGIEYDVDVDVTDDGGRLLLSKGKQQLNGRKALQYVQFRGTSTADIGRVARQRKFLTAVFSELKSLDKLSKLPSVYSAVMDKLNTNLTYAQVVNLLSFASTKLESDAIEGYTFPGGFKSGVSYWVIDQNKRIHFIYEMFGISVLPDEQD